MKAKLELLHDHQVARLTLAAPTANILDRSMLADLRRLLGELGTGKNLKSIVLIGEGPNFSYGASIQEHLPGAIEAGLEELRQTLTALAHAPAPTVAAVRGRCLGGGLELALACDLILAEADAQMGFPEIRLGVFPPAASALLPVKIGLGPAAYMTLTGANWTGIEAARLGLVARTAPSGQLEAELDQWLASDFLPRSAAGLRHAARAIRRPLLRALEQDLPVLEKMYITELMTGPDAEEGIRAFLEKRPPRFSG
jgi:cyclohexa-1,5-dienecarbonyl-CoA hydratase